MRMGDVPPSPVSSVHFHHHFYLEMEKAVETDALETEATSYVC